MTTDDEVVAMVTTIGSVNYGLAARQTVKSLLDHTDFRLVVGCDHRTRALIPDSARVTAVHVAPTASGRAGPFLAKFETWARAVDMPDARILLHVDADAVLTRALTPADIDTALGRGQLAMVEQTTITGSTMNRESFHRHYLQHSHAFLAPDHPVPDLETFRFHNSGFVVFRSLELRNFLEWAGRTRDTTDGSHTVGEHMIADQDYLQVWTNVFRRGACTDLDWSWNHCEWWDAEFPRPDPRILHFSNFCNGPGIGTAVVMERARGATVPPGSEDEIRVTALVVTHQSAGTISDCLSALSNVPGVRVLVVDNASTDATRSLTASSATTLNDRNIGFGAAVNQIVLGDSVTSEVICLVNPDCFVTAEAIEESLRVLRSEPRSVVVPRFVHSDGSVVNGRQPGYTKDKLRADILESNGRPERSARLRLGDIDDRSWHWPLAAFMMVRTDVFRSIGGFDPSYFCYMEDVELGLACAAASIDVIEIDVPVVHLGASGSSISIHRRTRLLDRSRLTFARRHHGLVFAARLWILRTTLRVRRRNRRVLPPRSRRTPPRTAA